MLEKFYPDEYLDSAYDINYEEFYEKGYRGVIFDIDNTLVPHGAPADERAKDLFARLKAIGYSCCLLSNNQRPRVEMFNREIQVNFIENAHKPSRKNYRKAMELMKTREKNTLWDETKRFANPHKVYVDLSDKLFKIKSDLLEQMGRQSLSL